MYFCEVNTHETYMQRCIALAKNGLGTTYPNPLVGSVIVCDGKIIGEGWHKKSGEAHAEVNAVNSVSDKSLLKKSTIYVSLEPCSHFGKTPPCCDLIIANGIPNVVVGTVDPNVKVAGNGIKKLIEAGRNVTVGILEAECQALNKRFFTYHEKKRPFIILKWAESVDGFMAPLSKTETQPVWISNVYSRQMVHKWRSEEQAILVGAQTVIDDNPKLNVRDWTGKDPMRIVINGKNRIPKTRHIFDNQTKTIIICPEKFSADKENLIFEVIDFTKNVVVQVADVLYRHNIQSVIIEGGRQTLQAFIDSGLWDEARVFRSNSFLKTGVKAPVTTTPFSEKQTVFDDELLIFSNHD